mmetsp:Transcript_4604/g.7137  ORF Transcript_4604/g.7137 Transcript_4604/m.7137 type:complete len:259 (+) Transcript_4604:892-1668(+)
MPFRSKQGWIPHRRASRSRILFRLRQGPFSCQQQWQESQHKSYALPIRRDGSRKCVTLVNDSNTAELSCKGSEEEKKKVTAKSLRIAGTTTMSAGNVDYYSSHARSGHVPTNQRYYIDNSEIQEMAPNYNHVDHNQEHGGTDLPDIISGAYDSRCFRTEVSFTPAFMMRPLRFKDPTKYNHCLALFNVVASPVDRAMLGRAGLTKTELSTAAYNIAEASMDHISALEGKPRSNRQKMGYAGVGGRVAKVKSKNPNLRL